MPLRPFSALLACFGLLAAGCSSDPKGGTVSGKVTLNGAPVSGVKLVFIDAAAKGTPMEYGTVTRDDGTYEITGLAPGSYKVTAQKLVARPGAKLPEEADPEQIEASGMGMNSLPAKYAEPGNSPLNATVKEGENKDVNFDLQGK